MKKYLLFVFLFVFIGLYSFTFSDTQAYGISLKIEGSDYPVNIPYGATTTLSWASTDMNSCTASQTGMPTMSAWNGSIGTEGNVSIPNLTNNVYFTLVCQNSDASISVSDSAQAYINFLIKPSLRDITTKEPGGRFIPGKTAFVSGNGFLPTDNTLNIGTLTTSPSSILSAASTDGKNLNFIVPDLNPGTYSFWITNWNGSTGFLPITIVSTSTPVLTIPTQTVAVQPIISQPSAITTTPSINISCTSLSYDLKYQSRDSNTKGGVSTLQTFLRENGDLDSESTGYFGSLTLAAVKKFQGDNGIITTGYVGPLTRAKIASMSCQL